MNIFKEDIVLPKDFPVGIGSVHVRYEGDNEKIYHWHECLEITYIQSGSGYYEVHGVTYPMEEDDIILFNNVEPHTWGCRSGEEMTVNVLMFNPSVICSGEWDLFDFQYLRPFNDRSTTFSNKLPSIRPETHQILQLIKEIEYEHRNRFTGQRLMIKTKILNILTLLVRHFMDGNKSSEQIQKKCAQLDQLKNVLAFIRTNYMDNLRLDDLAALAHMSPSYFSTFFKQAVNVSPVEYITRCRIGKAEQLLKTTNRTLLDIAAECGFNNMSNFYRSYKKVLGTTPKESRFE